MKSLYKECERALEKLLERCEVEYVFDKNVFNEIGNDVLQTMDGIGLIKVSFDIHNHVEMVQILPDGFAYLYRKKYRSSQRWWDFFTQFLSGVLVGIIVSVAAAWLISTLRIGTSNKTPDNQCLIQQQFQEEEQLLVTHSQE